MAGHRPLQIQLCTTCFVLFYLLLLAAPSPSHAARFPFHVQPHHELLHALGASVKMEKQSVVRSEHDAYESVHVVSRELASAKPPAQNVAHTDYICADSC